MPIVTPPGPPSLPPGPSLNSLEPSNILRTNKNYDFSDISENTWTDNRTAMSYGSPALLPMNQTPL